MRTVKRTIDSVTAKWAKAQKIKVWLGSDDKFYAVEIGNADTMQSELTAREALAAVLKKRDGDAVELPPPPPRKPRLTIVQPAPNPDAPGAAGDSGNENEGNDSEQPEPAPPALPPAALSRRGRVKVDKGLNGVQFQIKSRVALNENATIDEIFDEVTAAGFKTTRGTVLGLRSGCLHTMRVLRAIGMMPEKE